MKNDEIDLNRRSQSILHWVSDRIRRDQQVHQHPHTNHSLGIQNNCDWKSNCDFREGVCCSCGCSRRLSVLLPSVRDCCAGLQRKLRLQRAIHAAVHSECSVSVSLPPTPPPPPSLLLSCSLALFAATDACQLTAKCS